MACTIHYLSMCHLQSRWTTSGYATRQPFTPERSVKPKNVILQFCYDGIVLYHHQSLMHLLLQLDIFLWFSWRKLWMLQYLLGHWLTTLQDTLWKGIIILCTQLILFTILKVICNHQSDQLVTILIGRVCSIKAYNFLRELGKYLWLKFSHE